MRSQCSLALLVVLMCLCISRSNAEIALDKAFNDTSAIPLIENSIKNYAAPRAKGMFSDNIGIFDGKEDEDNSIFAWRISGKRYLSAIGRYTPDIAPLSDCDTNCDWIVNSHLVCHLFLFGADTLSLASVTPLNIVHDRSLLRGKTRCSSVKAMAVAGAARDSLLITLGYSDSAEPAEARYDPPEFITTVALHFDPTPGVLRVEQRDDCLGNPNGYQTIAAARKRLRECEAGITGSKESGNR
ncbi:hypothetical protein [Azoarcus sp. KH32C]|uniref:hypothetical protein n=1 Tax=Azoarcus sp. KH32C TaxID=748247 RepID=UPI00023861CE|nr:hypothetical protein [Azoarcus sp. KH32C]BAL26776.1 hypothetical protein AZKH_4503 [Azoarcus sp. KH32C]